jgi:enoyl-CoA hydratase/carnithine racemase
MTDHVQAIQAEGIATIRLARPEKKNALTRAMYGALAAGIVAAERDPAIRVILLAGGTDFTAGNDIADFAASREPGEAGAAFEFLEAMLHVAKPVVAAVRGHAVGIGTTLLLHCDVVVASETARLMMPFTRLALVPEAGSSMLLAASVGQAHANWWLLSGTPFSGLEAQRAGLAIRAVPDEEVEPVALEMARHLASLPPGAVAESKRLIRAPGRAALQAAMAAEREAFSARLRTEEAQAAFAGFLSRKA